MSILSLITGLKVIEDKEKGTIEVSGTNLTLFYRGIIKVYGSKVADNIFISRSTYRFKIHEFYLLDLVFIIDTLLNDKYFKRRPYGIKDAKDILVELEKLEIVKAYRDIAKINEYPSVNKSILSKVFIPQFNLLPHQESFIDSCLYKVSGLGLKGYLLDAPPGAGKSFCSLALAEIIKAKRIVIVCPKKAVLDVWETYINQYYQEKQQYCLSLPKVLGDGDNEITQDKRFFVVHYESIEVFTQTLMRLPKEDTMVILDESHNFNTHDSSRSVAFRELCETVNSYFTLWMSGTPFKAMGKEIFTMLSTIDPLFDKNVEKSFFEVFGKNSKTAMSIIANRIQLIRTAIPVKKLDTKLSTHQILVSSPDASQYTLKAVALKMRKYVEERIAFYKKNSKEYEKQYFQCIEEYKKTVRDNKEKTMLDVYLSITKRFHVYGFNAYDKKDSEDSKWCKQMEEKFIIPKLSSESKKVFRKSKSVYKYYELTVMGEALGNILGKARVECNLAIIRAMANPKNVTIKWEDGEETSMSIDEIIGSAEGKTICFTDYVEVVKGLEQELLSRGSKPITVFGDNTNELNKRVSVFTKDEQINPMITTYKSLGEAVPLLVANRVLFLNAPFRSNIEDQAVKRAYRIGQTKDVDLFRVKLDTGNEPNVSTRSEDIANWSREQVAILLGEKSVDMSVIEGFIKESNLIPENNTLLSKVVGKLENTFKW